MAVSPSYTAPGPSPFPFRPPGRATALVVAMEAPPRLLAIEHCRAEIARFAALRRQLTVFQETDLPAFRTWLYMKFAKRIGELRSLRARAVEQQALIAEVDAEVVRRRIPFHKAYRAVLLRRDAARASEEAEALLVSAPPDDRWSGPEGASPRFEDPTELWLAGIDTSDWEDTPCGLPTFDRCFGTGLGAAASESERLRAAYRRLVRALHPDLHPDSGAESRDLWIEVQCAYRSRDTHRLETIAAVLQVESEAQTLCGSSLRESPLSQLRDVKREAEAKRRTLSRERARLEKHPAWEFTQRRGRFALAELRGRVTTDLAVFVRRARRELSDLRLQVKRLAKPPTLPAKRRRDDAAQLQFDF